MIIPPKDRPIDRVLGKLPDCKASGKGWVACCPAHDDHNPSLSITEGEGGKVLLKCHADCETEAVLSAIQLTFADLSPAAEASSRTDSQRVNGESRKEVAVYTYRDEQGKVLSQVVRFEPRTLSAATQNRRRLDLQRQGRADCSL